MPYEDDYKMWLEEALISMNPDWICDGMYDTEFTHDWCSKYCGEDDAYITPKCLHMYYHHIEKADRKTEPTGYNLSPVDKDINVRSKDEPQTCSFGLHMDCSLCWKESHCRAIKEAERKEREGE